jgi:hypothetical protein
MQPEQWTVILFNSLVAALLLFASFAKLVSPAMLARTLFLMTNRESLSTATMVRAIAVAEAASAIGIMVPVLRLAAAAAIGVLGVAFTVSGVAARVRHVEEPCGCFGAVSRQPIGLLNVSFGVVIIADAVFNFVIRGNLVAEYAAKAPAFTGILICAICLITWLSAARQRSDSPAAHS